MSAGQLPIVNSARVNADFFTALRADCYTDSDWDQLYRYLASGERVTVHYTVWCRLLENEEIRSASRLGIILNTGGMLVRLSSPQQHRNWLQALATPPGIAIEPGHEHSVTPVERSDGWECIRCVRCGGEW